jgi:hypothetical protein
MDATKASDSCCLGTGRAHLLVALLRAEMRRNRNRKVCTECKMPRSRNVDEFDEDVIGDNIGAGAACITSRVREMASGAMQSKRCCVHVHDGIREKTIKERDVFSNSDPRHQPMLLSGVISDFTPRNVHVWSGGTFDPSERANNLWSGWRPVARPTVTIPPGPLGTLRQRAIAGPISGYSRCYGQRKTEESHTSHTSSGKTNGCT